MIWLRDMLILLLALAAGLSTGWRWGPRREPAADTTAKANAISEAKAGSTAPQPAAIEPHEIAATKQPEPSVVLAVMLDEWDADKAWPVLCSYTAEQLSGLIELCDNSGDKKRGNQLIELALRAWARLDIDAAMSRAREAKDESIRGSRIGAVLASMLLQSPDEAMRQASALKSDNEKQAAALSLLKHWVAMDREAALRWHDSHPPAVDDAAAARLLFSNSPASFAAQLAEALSLNRADFRGEAFREVIHRWIEIDPGAAFQHQASQTDPAARSSLFAAAGRWAGLNPDAALAAVSQLADAKLRESSRYAVFYAVFANAVEAGHVDFVLQQLGGEPPPEVVSSISDGFKRSYRSLSWSEFDQILTVLPESAKKMEVISEAAIEAGESLRTDRLAQLLVHLPEGKGRQDALRASCMIWQAVSPEGLASWMAQLTTDADRDWVLAGMARGLAVSNPQEAAALLDQASSPEARKEVIRGVSANWMASDPAAAKAWVSSLRGISEIERAELMENAGSDW